MKKILIIEDEEFLRTELKMLLSNAGYLVECIVDFNNIVDQIKSLLPDLILLDINLPGEDGYHICASIRSFTQTPIIFITGRNTPMDELQALTLGGNDYITKPYNIPILLARINLLIKSNSRNSNSTSNDKNNYINYNGIQLRPIAGTLIFDGQEIELTKTEIKIIYYLFTHAGEIVSRLELVEYLWDNEIHIDDNTLSVNIMRIRDKLSSLGVPDLIQTKRGMGYKV